MYPISSRLYNLLACNSGLLSLLFPCGVRLKPSFNLILLYLSLFIFNEWLKAYQFLSFQGTGSLVSFTFSIILLVSISFISALAYIAFYSGLIPLFLVCWGIKLGCLFNAYFNMFEKLILPIDFSVLSLDIRKYSEWHQQLLLCGLHKSAPYDGYEGLKCYSKELEGRGSLEKRLKN